MKKIKEFFVNLWTNIKKNPFGFIGKTILLILAIVILVCSFTHRNYNIAEADTLKSSSIKRIEVIVNDESSLATNLPPYFTSFYMGTRISVINAVPFFPSSGFSGNSLRTPEFHFSDNTSTNYFKCRPFNADTTYKPSIFFCFFTPDNNNQVLHSFDRFKSDIDIYITDQFGVDINGRKENSSEFRYITLCFRATENSIIYNYYLSCFIPLSDNTNFRCYSVLLNSSDNFTNAIEVASFILSQGTSTEYTQAFRNFVKYVYIGYLNPYSPSNPRDPNNLTLTEFFYSRHLYQYGYESGNTNGFSSGYESGYEAGTNQGSESSYNEGFNAGHTAGRNEALTEGLKNPISFILSPISVFFDTKLFGVVSIGQILSIFIFVAVGLIFIKMFAGG